ncbi:MAG: hypothetical protein ORN85_07890 [Sediminibacterium sp.]|nr:hypothetical protein [Sediminibacterium sp.]
MLNQLGEEIKTPFDLVYLQQGLQVLKDHKGSYSDFFTFEDLKLVILSPNMYYMCFKPKNAQETFRLLDRTDIGMLDHPLNYKLLDTINRYRTPNIPDNQPNYLYSLVKITDTIPQQISHNIIKEILNPIEINDNAKVSAEKIKLSHIFKNLSKNDNDILLANIIYESAKITETEIVLNEFKKFLEYKKLEKQNDVLGKKQIQPFVDCFIFCSAFQPSGKIKVYYDDFKINSEAKPLVGLRVDAWTWFLPFWGTATTNNDGWFNIHTFISEVSYDVRFENSKLMLTWSPIQDNILGTTITRAAFGGFDNINMIFDGLNGYNATIYRAAYNYMNGNTFGFTKPQGFSIFGGIFGRRFTIWTLQGNQDPDGYGGWTNGIGLNIPDYRNGGAISYLWDVCMDMWRANKVRVYSTTIHEMAHGVHAQNNLPGFYGPWLAEYKSASESYATGVQYVLTKEEYPLSFVPYSLSYITKISPIPERKAFNTDAWLYNYINSNDEFILKNDLSRSRAYDKTFSRNRFYTNVIRDLIDYKPDVYNYEERWSFTDNCVISYKDSIGGISPSFIDQALFGIPLSVTSERYFEEWGNRLANYYNYDINIKNAILRCFKYWNIDVLHPDFNPCTSVATPPTPPAKPPTRGPIRR